MSKTRTGRKRPVRIVSALGAVAALSLAAAPAPLSAATVAAPASAERQLGQQISDFYAARNGRPLWFGNGGRSAAQLLDLLRSASADGLDPNRYDIAALDRAVRSAGEGRARAVRKADRMLSEALVAYVRDMRRSGGSGTIWVDPQLRPSPPSPRAILDAAARSPERYVTGMGWMHPLYAELRAALAHGQYDQAQRSRIRLNLERLRDLPADRKHVLVNAAEQRLYMYEGNRVADSMRVVVGKPIYPTPMMAALIRFASLNPYWYVPTDLAAERIAPTAARQGQKYLDRQGYEVVTSFGDDGKVLDPSTVDWKAVADGREKILIRQQPGPYNAMGRIKFMFPNSQGIYLHDNPERELFEQAARLYSGGCVRLESAWKLSRWLFDRELDWKGAAVEQEVNLAKPVPVYITYLTTVPQGSTMAFLDDVYGRDKAQVAQLSGGSGFAGN